MATTPTTTPTTTISPCGYPPALLNGEIVRITSSTAEYGCLTGFVMSGSKVILCSGSGGTWATDLPSCAVIDQSPEVYVFADWWQYFLAALLSFIALLLLAFLIWCCCCPHPTPRSEGQIRFMQVVQEVVDEDKNRKKAKPVNQWMPHSHPVRNINTSTK
ncbi:uncharacterized protein LOC124283274 [Haliotis rubra]|uniref:uncharacterized protein LOC124283274 n=1 Tax=Haliotis rubra TaxID=36100 RepID=UPI001EE61D13|nr:uncharacterized protein LOC124283274 [Haliotis rubra]